MKYKLLFLLITLIGVYPAFAQNVGIGNRTPSEKLHVDSGSIKIGVNTWNTITPPLFLKFGDGNFITLGEEEADDKLTIRAKELFIRPSASYNSVPLSIQGTTNYSHFYFGVNEDTYIRAGKNSGNVILNDITGGKLGIGMGNPTRAIVEQYGSVGATAAIFGGDGTGISLQKNWPAIGFNSYLDGSTHRAINGGWGAQLGLNQQTGALYLVSWANSAAGNQPLTGPIQRFYVSKFGKIGVGTDDPQSDLHIVQTTNNSASGIRLEYSSGSEFSSWNIYTQTGTFASGDFYANPLFFDCNNTPGFAAIGDDGFYQVSDLSQKKNIHYLNGDNLLSKILRLRPANYLMKEDAAGHPLHYGFISQEVERIFPEFILTTKENVKMLCYSSFIPILTKGIQEQQQQIDDLKKEIAELKKLILSKQ